MDKAGRRHALHIIYSQLQPAPVLQKEGFAEIPPKIGTHALFLRGSLKGNIALKD